MSTPDLDGWLPVRVGWAHGRPFVDWCKVDGERFTEPFFDHTIERCLRDPFRLLFRQDTAIETLVEWAQARPGIRPAGFILHMSRCGSTLVSQMLAALPKSVVISEAAPLDAVIHARDRVPGLAESDHISCLRAMMSALGQPRAGDETRFFVKFDAWHTFELPLIRAAFPDVPWIFVCRDPVEVLVSVLRESGAFFGGALGRRVPVITPEEAREMPPVEYSARGLGAICEAALRELRSGCGLVVDYSELPGAACGKVARHFGIAHDDSEIERMHAVAQFNAKSPSLFFKPDADEKQREAGDEARACAARWIARPYEELAAFR